MIFERGQEPKKALEIGLINTTKRWLETNLKVYNNTIEFKMKNGACYIDCVGDLYFKDFDINDVKTIPEEIKFRNVKGRYIFEKKPPS